MRIEDLRPNPYENVRVGRKEKADASSSSQSINPPSISDAESGPTRSERIDQLKQMFQQGRPIDVNKLAQKLLESGILLEDKG